MAAGDRLVPDWRDAAAYQPLLEADRSLFAWEWLRRNPGYRAAADQAFGTGSHAYSTGAGEAPERWGLHAFVQPWLAAPEARPVWSANVHPYVLGIDADPARSSEEAFDLERLGAASTLVMAADGREHLLISDGLRVVRLDVLSGTVAGGPASLRYRLAGFASAERPVMTLRRLLALSRTGCFSRSLHPREARARRWLLMLRARDALVAGANQRAIAAELLAKGAVEERWRVQAASLRSQAQRLVMGARRMAAGGFWDLLN